MIEDKHEQSLKRFMAKVQKSNDSNGCWIWTGGRMGTNLSYGQICGTSLGLPRTVGAHRFSWVLFNGEIGPDLQVMHDCPGGDNKLCVNPSHLKLGTRKEHGADTKAKGQFVSGDKHHFHLRPELVKRGDQHWSRVNPEKRATGAKHGMNLHPERRLYGEINPSAVISNTQRIEILKAYKDGNTRDKLLDLFPISEKIIGGIISKYGTMTVEDYSRLLARTKK